MLGVEKPARCRDAVWGRPSESSGAMVLQTGDTSQSPGGLVRSKATGLHSKVSDSTGLGKGFRNYISNRLSGAETGGLLMTVWKPLVYRISSSKIKPDI